MQKKILSDQTLEELRITEKRYHKIVLLHFLSFLILLGIAVYMTLENDLNIFTVLPLFFIPIYIYTLINLKKVKKEIKSRTSYISMQKKMQENK